MAKKRKETTPHLRIRIEPELLARLEKSRSANNRTLTGEIVHRIEQTFRKSDDADLAILVYRAAFGDLTGDLLRAFATAIWLIERRTGKKWHEDVDASFQTSTAIDEIFKWFMTRRGDDDFLLGRAVRLKYGVRDPIPAPSDDPSALHKKFEQIHRAGQTAALETLRQMGMAPSDAEIDAADAKRRAEVSDADEPKDTKEKGNERSHP
jgi:hypothetical protein